MAWAEPKRENYAKHLAKKSTPDNIRVIEEIRDNPKAPWAVRLAAANSLLDRGWGKAHQEIALESEANISISLNENRAGQIMLEEYGDRGALLAHEVVADAEIVDGSVGLDGQGISGGDSPSKPGGEG